jgi:tetratricopeptide (TPR) repeat protein
VLALLVLFVYAGMPADELTFDSAYVVGEDTRLKVFSAESFIDIARRDYWWPTLTSVVWRPLTTLGFAIEHAVFGFQNSPLGYQLNNALLHWLTSVLVFWVALRIGRSTPAAWFAAVIFCVHPVATESVANIVGRSDLLAASATLGGLLCYLRALDEPLGARRLRWLAGAGGCALAGILSKENAAVLPAIIGLHGLLRGAGYRSGPEDVRRLWWFDAKAIALVMLPAGLTLLAARWWFNREAGGQEVPFIDNPLIIASFLERQLTAWAVWGMQLQSFFAPLAISSDYSFNQIPVAVAPWGNSTAVWGWATLLGMSGVAALLWFKRGVAPDALLFCGGAYALATLPTANIVLLIGSIRADRFHYLPSAFFWIFVALVVLSAARALSDRLSVENARRLRGVMFAVVGGWALCIGLLAHFRCYDWRNNLTLWQSALVAAPDSAKVRAAVGLETNRVINSTESLRDAIARSVAALELYQINQVPKEHWPLRIFSDIGAYTCDLYDKLAGKPETKEEADRYLAFGLEWTTRGLDYEKVVRERWIERRGRAYLGKDPIFEMLSRNHAELLQRQGRLEEALAILHKLSERMPFRPGVRNVMANILVAQGKHEEALIQWALVAFISPEERFFVTSVERSLRAVHPEANPTIRNEKGETLLNLSDPAVTAMMKVAAPHYSELLRKEGRLLDEARFRRVLRYDYGIDSR